MSILSKPLVLVTEALLALAASSAAPLAASGKPPLRLLLPLHFFFAWMVRAATALSRAVSSPWVVSSSTVAGCTAATTVFLEFLASQMTSAYLASSTTPS